MTSLRGLVPSEDVNSASDSVDDVTSQVILNLKHAMEDFKHIPLVVLEQFVDVAARAATLRATHKQLLALMQRADTVEDVLKVPSRMSSDCANVPKLNLGLKQGPEGALQSNTRTRGMATLKLLLSLITFYR